jgi:hypothetical protein
MPRTEDRDLPAASRPGPYETSYQVLRGYDGPAPSAASPQAPAPVLVAGSLRIVRPR